MARITQDTLQEQSPLAPDCIDFESQVILSRYFDVGGAEKGECEDLLHGTKAAVHHS